MLVQTKKFTIAEYHRLVEMGIVKTGDCPENERTELVRGEIVYMVAKGIRHTFCCRNLIKELPKLIRGRAKLQCQDPIFLPPDSEPEPDLTIVSDHEDNYLTGHPSTDDILLVIGLTQES
ncbi:MAG: Uma2 family endonuclease [Pseudanabaena sp.]